MPDVSLNLHIVVILTVGFAYACALGYLSHRLKLSPILGYLVAGYLIGPYSPGYVADAIVAEQLAEVGVILMMFGVGLHFKLGDLLKVKNIAIPGAIIQTLVSTFIGGLLIYELGWGVEAAVIFGFSIGVASTIVLVRALTDNHLLATQEGHIAVGWLIVEDVITVFVLLLVPILAPTEGVAFSLADTSIAIGMILVKFIILLILTFTIGEKIVQKLMNKIVKTHNQELFTLAILAFTLAIATASTVFFGTSIALGAFIAGMMFGQTDERRLVTLNASPIRDVFSVIFFISVGMLFNPEGLNDHFQVFFGVLAIILLVKPLVAFLIVILFRYPLRVAMTIAISLSQIGEFSFILAEEGLNYHLLPDEGYDIIIGCALVSISINPLFFKLLPKHKPLAI